LGGASRAPHDWGFVLASATVAALGGMTQHSPHLISNLWTALNDPQQLVCLEAARELIVALKEQRPSRIILIGHTDTRGTTEFNLKLSRERANSVAGFLRQNGLGISVEATGKGSNEPMQLSDKSGLSQDDIYSLNRRVEWRRE
jgi:hypothetical protein